MGTLTPEYRWLLPAALTVEADEGMRRSTRDWVIDALCFVIGFGFTVLATGDLLQDHPNFVAGFAGTPTWLIWTDFAIGTALAISLWWRRRFPVPLAIAAALAGTVSLSSALSGVVLLFTVAVHRRFGVTAAIGGLSFATGLLFSLIRPERNSSFLQNVVWGVVFTVIAILWGMVVRARRQLVVSLRDRAERAESEQQLRVAQARVLERNRIAREMHDVVAHHMSMIAVRAETAPFRVPGMTEETQAEMATIASAAREALTDMRRLLGVLRSEKDETLTAPQPGLADVDALVETARAAGLDVAVEIEELEVVPPTVGLAAYRIVQEALANAARHAPDGPVTIKARGSSERLLLLVRNPLPLQPRSGSGGHGLAGMRERATLLGGTLSAGPDNGEFVVAAILPIGDEEAR
jgi:signal transduction histidine kinase